MKNVSLGWLSAVVCSASMLLIGGCGSSDSSGGGGEGTGSTGTTSGHVKETPEEGCTTKAGGACTCQYSCDGVWYALECDGQSCSCIDNGKSIGSFGQAAACNYATKDHIETVEIATEGCPLPQCEKP